MTDPTPTPTPAPTPTPRTPTPPPAADPSQDAPDDLGTLPADRLAAMLREKRRAEASVRGKLREAETERDTLRGTVNAYRADTVQQLATLAGVVPSALADLAQYLPADSVLGDDGLVDPEKVSAALADLRASRPHLFRSPPGSSGPGRPQGGGSGTATATWGDVLH